MNKIDKLSKIVEVGYLTGKRHLGFEGTDEVGSFWVVTMPTPPH